MISVIVPLYNKGIKVCRTIDSVLKQEYQDFEVIVVDDGSKDDSASFVRHYTDSRVKYFYKQNGGVSSARNFGIKVSKGEWLLFLDADDEIVEGALEELFRLYRLSCDCKCFVGQTKWVQNGKEKGACSKDNKMYCSKNPFFLVWANKLYPATRNMMIHRSLIDEYGSFDERISFYEDWEFSLRMLRCGKIAYTNKYIGVYNQDGTGLSGSKHPVEKEMAFYVPELMQKAGFWEKCIMYSNIEETKIYWNDDENIQSMYKSIQKRSFSFVFFCMHTIRQKMKNKGIL